MLQETHAHTCTHAHQRLGTVEIGERWDDTTDIKAQLSAALLSFSRMWRASTVCPCGGVSSEREWSGGGVS